MKLLPLPREKRRLLEPLGRAALTCLLTAGSFGGLCAPLPLAITAAAGPGLPGLCCVLGCGLGAFLFLPFQAGLRQLAAAILIFSGSIAFFDTKFFPRRFSGRVLRRRCCFWCSRRISSPGPSGCGPCACSAWASPPRSRTCCCAAGTGCPCCWRRGCAFRRGLSESSEYRLECV